MPNDLLTKPYDPKVPTRDQLAKWLPNQEAIRFMERLFKVAGELAPKDIANLNEAIFSPPELPYTEPKGTDNMILVRGEDSYQVKMVALHTFFNLGFPSKMVINGTQVTIDGVEVISRST